MKKTIDEYMKLPYKMEIVEDVEEGGYVAAFPDLPGCISSGETIEVEINNLDDAKKVWLEAAIEDGMKIAEP